MYEARPGTWLLLPSQKYLQTLKPKTHLLSAYFLCQWPSGENFFSNKDGLLIQGRAHPELESKATQLDRIVRKWIPGADTSFARMFSNFDSFLSFQALFLQWLSVWVKVCTALGAVQNRIATGDDRLLKAVRCLNNAELDSGFPLSKLQNESGLGEPHLNRLFLKAYGLSLRKYWEQRKLEFSKKCLGTSNILVKEVAYRLGFRSDSHFVVWFRHLSGLSPSEYREYHARNLPT